MLLSFRFANHLSFREEQQLNLTPVYENDARQAPAVLQVVGVFGANASGKSNLIGAFGYMRRLIGTSDREVEPGVAMNRLKVRRRPFRLDPAQTAQPSSYVVDLLLHDIRYTYGFVLDDERIREEWLYGYPLNRKRIVFHRKTDKFQWGEDSSRPELREIAAIVAPTALFLSVVARFAPVEVPGDTYIALHGVYSALSRRISQVRAG